MARERYNSEDGLRSLCQPENSVSYARTDSRLTRAVRRIGEWCTVLLVAALALLLIVPGVVLFVLACVRMGRPEAVEQCSSPERSPGVGIDSRNPVPDLTSPAGRTAGHRVTSSQQPIQWN